MIKHLGCFRFWCREGLLVWRRPLDSLQSIVFFSVVVGLFPLAFSPTPTALQSLGPAIVWVATLLATLLSVSSLFQEDWADGSLDQARLSEVPLAYWVFAKLGVVWIAMVLPLLGVIPFVILLYGLSWQAMGVLMLSILLGTPTLCVLSALGSALTISLPSNPVVTTVFIFPLQIPVLVFGAGSTLNAIHGQMWLGPMVFLGAFAVAAVSILPWVIAAILEI